jgi:hypothetical protein
MKIAGAEAPDMGSAFQHSFHACAQVADQVRSSNCALLTDLDDVEPMSVPPQHMSLRAAELLRDPEDEEIEFKYETGDGDSLANPWLTGNTFFEKSQQSTHTNVQSTTALEHWLVEANAKREVKCHAIGNEDREVIPWSSSKLAGTQSSCWSSQGGRQRRRHRLGTVKIAECLVALDHVADARRILRFSRMRSLGLRAQEILKSHLEARHGRVSMMLAGNMERKHGPGMFFVVMERVEVALALLAGSEEREIVIGDAAVLVRTFKRTTDA